MLSTRAVHVDARLSVRLALALTLGCSAGGGSSGGSEGGVIVVGTKADDFAQCPELEPIEAGKSRTYDVTGQKSFRAVLEQGEGASLARLVAIGDDHTYFGAGSTHPEVSAIATTDDATWKLRVENLSREPLRAKLCSEPLEPPARDPSVPRFEVRFTRPACEAHPDLGVPEGALCTGASDERAFSRSAAGVADELEQWFDDARAAAEAGRDVKVTMAFLTWSDARMYDAICRATAAGVKLEGFFDEGNGGSQPSKLANDPACNPENVTLHSLGGLTSWPTWRLMHIKLVMFEDGGETSRMVFGSANLSSYALSIHFENWVFAEVPSASHFVATHRCAAEALRSAAQVSYPEDADRFEETFDGCVATIEAQPDPNLQVFFSPDRDRAMLHAVIAEMAAAESGVDMAIQHFNESLLARQLAANGRDESLVTRLVLDDDTFYNEGESAAEDHWTYTGQLEGQGIDIRFVQTNGRMTYGKQYQHNKYVLIDDDVVFMGAGNFTDVAFGKNYENFYLLRSPELARAYRAHFERLFQIARPAEELPAEPPTP